MRSKMNCRRCGELTEVINLFGICQKCFDKEMEDCPPQFQVADPNMFMPPDGIEWSPGDLTKSPLEYALENGIRLDYDDGTSETISSDPDKRKERQ